MSDDEIARVVGGPAFPSGCRVEGDLSAWASGEPTELTLSARIEVEGRGRLVISNLPPDCTVGEVAQGIAHRVDAGLPVRDVVVEWLSDGSHLLVEVQDEAVIDDVRDAIAELWGLRRTVAVWARRPIAEAIRAFGTGDDLDRRLALIDAGRS